MKKEKIKKCPFCGSEASIYVSEWGDIGRIRCKECYAQIEIGSDFAREDVIKAWNKRFKKDKK